MSRQHATSIIVLLAVLSLCANGSLLGGERLNIQGMGMARTYVAASRGIDAVGLNPANLVDPEGPTVSFGLLPFGVHVGSDFMSYDLYRTYFTGVETDSGRVGRYLDDLDKQHILDAFPDGVGTVSADVEARPIGLLIRFGFGTVALTMTERASMTMNIPHEYAQFILYGNTPGSTYDFAATHVAASWTREYALSFARSLPDLFIAKNVTGGFAVKLVHGYGYAELNRFNTSLVTSNTGVLNGTVDLRARVSGIDPLSGSQSGNYTPFPAPAGSGIGVDLGVAGELTSFLRVGVAVTDIGSILWSRNVEEMRADTSVMMDDPLDENQRNGLDDVLKGESMTGSPFRTSLPTALRVGVAVELQKLPLFKRLLLGEMTLAADYNQGLAEGPGMTMNPRFSLGMEYRPWKFLPLCTGVSFGGTDHFNYAMGLGFHLGLFDLDLASENLGWLFSRGTFSYGSLAMGMRLNF